VNGKFAKLRFAIESESADSTSKGVRDISGLLDRVPIRNKVNVDALSQAHLQFEAAGNIEPGSESLQSLNDRRCGIGFDGIVDQGGGKVFPEFVVLGCDQIRVHGEEGCFLGDEQKLFQLRGQPPFPTFRLFSEEGLHSTPSSRRSQKVRAHAKVREAPSIGNGGGLTISLRFRDAPAYRKQRDLHVENVE